MSYGQVIIMFLGKWSRGSRGTFSLLRFGVVWGFDGIYGLGKSTWDIQQIKQNNQQLTMSVSSGAANRIARLKLMKDLKYGKVHLRQSLLEMSQFEDVNRLFKNRKQFYSIQDLDVNLQKVQVEQVQQQGNILMSPAERIQLFRKEKQEKKLKQKMQSMWSKQVKKVKPRVPSTSKMLQKFESKYKNEMHISYKEQLRQSELNLQKIKKNNKTTFQTQSQHKSMYRSRLASESAERTESKSPRKRFISLKTSLPQKQKFVYESIRQIMKGKIKQNVKRPAIDIKSLENALDSYVHQSFKKLKIKIERDVQLRNNISNSPTKIKDYRASSRQQDRSKAVKSNVERSFTRSEQSSKRMVDTMSDFYQTKHKKKDVFDEMVNNLKYDRPLTASIRRKTYTVLGKQTLFPIKDYRQISQKQRQKLRTHNHQFYCSLIEGLQNYHQQDIPTTVFIVEQIKRIFETEYMLHEDIFKDLIEKVSTMKIDHKSEDILHRVAHYAGFNLLFTTAEEDGKIC